MSAADYACDFWNNAGTHPYLQQRMNQMQYYREPTTFEAHSQEAAHQDYYYNGYNYPISVKNEQHPMQDVSSSPSTSFRYDYQQQFNACRSTTEDKSSDDAPALRALLTKPLQKNQKNDCNYYKSEDGESSCDYNKLDMLLSPCSERSSDSEMTKPPAEPAQPQFYPWMKSHHGKSVSLPPFDLSSALNLQELPRRKRENARARPTPATKPWSWRRSFTSTSI